MQHRLELYLLGTFQALRDGETSIRFEYDKVRALLAYLAVESDLPQRRRSLTGLFWPEQTDAVARKSLNQALYTLRKALGDQEVTAVAKTAVGATAVGAAAVPFILVDRTAVQLNPEADVWLDVQAFARQVGNLADPSEAEMAPARRRQLEEALSLYRGDFLQGLSLPDSVAFDDWAALQRERLHRQAMDALFVLARYHEWRGELADAARYTRRQLELEPWREEAHRQLMRILAHSGQRSAALVQYRLCRQTLQAELGLEPGRDTQALAERIRQADGSRRHNLPTQLTPFVGRREELATLSSLLAQPGCRVLALVGQGGVGKTRLALQAAVRIEARFLDGVWYVPLVDVKTAETVPLAIADALGHTLTNEMAPLEELLNYLQQKELLLLLDSFESLQGGMEIVAEIVRQAPQVKVLLTSRERPNLAAAWLFDVPGLDVPAGDAPEAVEASSAGQLFVHSACRARHDFTLGPGDAPAISRICTLVEGLPLALELAAPWTRSLPCAAVLAATEQNIDFLAASFPDMPPRHRSMRAVIDHSWALLAPPEQALFSRLSVFPTTFTRQAALQVCAAALDTLTALVDKSLVRRTADGRYALHELLRQYAAHRLAAPGPALDETRQQHARYYSRLVQKQAEPLSRGNPEPAIHALEAEWGHVRAAWQWAVTQARLDILQAISSSLFWWCQWSNRYHEGKALFQLAANRLIPSGEPEDPWLARLLAQYGRFCTQLAEYETAEALFARSLPLLRRAKLPAELAQVLDFWGDLERQRGAYAAARAMLEESVSYYRKLAAPSGLAQALDHLGIVLHRQGDYGQARGYAQESLELYRQTGNRWGAAAALFRLGHAAYDLGDFALAEQYYTESLQLRRELGDQWGLARTYNNLGIIFYDAGDPDRAEQYYLESLALRQALGDKRGTAVIHNNLGLIAGIRRQHSRAEQLYRQSLELCRQIGNQRGVCIALNNLGKVAAALERYQEAYAYHQESLTIAREIGYRRSVCFALEYLGLVALNLSRLEEAQRHFLEALHIAWHDQAMPRVLSALDGLAGVYQRSGNAAQAAALARIVAAHPAAEEHTRTNAAALLTGLGAAVQEAGAGALAAAVCSLLEEAPP